MEESYDKKSIVSGGSVCHVAGDIKHLVKNFHNIGFQATNLSNAISIVNMMLEEKQKELVMEEESSHIAYVPKTTCTIFLSYTSGMVSSGVREYIRYLVQNRLVDCLVTAAGSVEEDFIKCMAPTYLSDFNKDGATLRNQELNRIGNLVIHSTNYQLFEDWLTPLIAEMHQRQNEEGVTWTPSKMINFLGSKIDCPDSIYYWAYKNDIPVFSPALTDGSIGDILYFYSINNPGFRLDIVEDVCSINNIAKYSVKTGMIILGGGLIKHHTCNANLMRNGAEYTVYINTATEYDGSDSGASPDEAISWGKLKIGSPNVKVFGDASILFPLLVHGSKFTP